LHEAPKRNKADFGGQQQIIFQATNARNERLSFGAMEGGAGSCSRRERLALHP
jgi:hypothetical protein